MKRFVKGILVGGAALAATVAMTVPAGATAKAPTGPYYLALGDSLSQGYEPNANGIGVDTDNGYVDDIYNAELASTPTLQLVKLGCPGETTYTFLHGGICPFSSQISRAVKFLKKYGSQTAFVTIDIGANNVDNCVVNGAINNACVAAGFKQMGKQLPVILTDLRTADPTVPIYAMNYYDPFLAAYLTFTPGGQQEAGLSIPLSNTFNADEAAIYSAFGVTNVDVSNGPADPNIGGLSFSTGDASSALTDFSDGYTIPTPDGAIPIPNDVGGICALTYMCQPAPVGPNIHANNLGYQYIADQFLAAINPAP